MDHEAGVLRAGGGDDVYSGCEPMHAFDGRIGFCMGMGDACVRAMRFPMNLKKIGDGGDGDELREREREISEMVDDLGEEDDDVGF